MAVDKKSITVFEYDCIKSGDGEKDISPQAFKELREYILPTDAETEENADEPIEITDASVCMTLGAKDGKEVIRVKNYVGTIALPCGTVIEVLPKIALNNDINASRKLVVKMLQTCGIIPYKSFQNANLYEDKLSLFEIFIRVFAEEVTRLCKRELKAGYVTHEDNENFFKGKLHVSEHVKRNFAHGERFYVSYDEFGFNRPENRLIKSALLYLKGKSADEENKRLLRKLMLLLDEIEPSENIESDFNKCAADRSVKDYESVMKMCRVFLRGKSFTMYSGEKNMRALMFPMEKLYEKYVFSEMETALAGSEWLVKEQDTGKYLFDDKRFPLRPDIVLASIDNKIIIDTKWKMLINDSSSNYGISQADMYQMYAYHTRYDNVAKVILLYPYYENWQNDEWCRSKFGEYTITANGSQVKIQIRFFDLNKHISEPENYNDLKNLCLCTEYGT